MSTISICKMYLLHVFYRKFHTFILFDDIVTRHVRMKSYPYNWYTRYSIEGIHIVYAKKRSRRDYQRHATHQKSTY